MAASSGSRTESSGNVRDSLKRVGAAASDTGPILHLHEIGCLDSLEIFSQIERPPLVEQELSHCELGRPWMAPGTAPEPAGRA